VLGQVVYMISGGDGLYPRLATIAKDLVAAPASESYADGTL